MMPILLKSSSRFSFGLEGNWNLLHEIMGIFIKIAGFGLIGLVFGCRLRGRRRI
jgi:hypothetical protein